MHRGQGTGVVWALLAGDALIPEGSHAFGTTPCAPCPHTQTRPGQGAPRFIVPQRGPSHVTRAEEAQGCPPHPEGSRRGLHPMAPSRDPQQVPRGRGCCHSTIQDGGSNTSGGLARPEQGPHHDKLLDTQRGHGDTREPQPWASGQSAQGPGVGPGCAPQHTHKYIQS